MSVASSASPAGLPSIYECKLLLRHLIREDRDGQFFFEPLGSEDSFGSIEDELFGEVCSPDDFLRKIRGLLKAAATAEVAPRRQEASRLLRIFEAALPLISGAEEQAKHADMRLGVTDTYYERSTERSAKEIFAGESTVSWEVDILFERFTFAGTAYSAWGQPLPDQSSRVRTYISLRLGQMVERMKKQSETDQRFTAYHLTMTYTRIHKSQRLPFLRPRLRSLCRSGLWRDTEASRVTSTRVKSSRSTRATSMI